MQLMTFNVVLHDYVSFRFFNLFLASLSFMVLYPFCSSLSATARTPSCTSARARPTAFASRRCTSRTDRDHISPAESRHEFTSHVTEGCSIKQVFVLDLIKVLGVDLNFLAKISEDFN